MSRLKEVTEVNDNIKEIAEKYKEVMSAEQQKDIGLGFIVTLLMNINETLAIIADDKDKK